jgi:CubicO group peptidase (beta-lactamase class C family)
VEVQGFADGRFGMVRQCFAEILDGQAGTGAAFAAWCDGRLVVDLWGGFADLGRRRRWEAGSLVQPYSVSKPFAAMCALRLVQAGRLDLDAPVQRYWPGFRAPATVRHVLSHQAGVVMLDRAVPTEAFYDWDWLCALLAAQQPSWQPGTAHGESPLFYGHLVGELVRRVDGRGVGRFLAEEICGPAGLEFAFGLSPSQQARAVDLTGLDDAFRAGNAAGRPSLRDRQCRKPRPGRQAGEHATRMPWARAHPGHQRPARAQLTWERSSASNHRPELRPPIPSGAAASMPEITERAGLARLRAARCGCPARRARGRCG